MALWFLKLIMVFDWIQDRRARDYIKKRCITKVGKLFDENSKIFLRIANLENFRGLLFPYIYNLYTGSNNLEWIDIMLWLSYHAVGHNFFRTWHSRTYFDSKSPFFGFLWSRPEVRPYSLPVCFLEFKFYRSPPKL